MNRRDCVENSKKLKKNTFFIIDSSDESGGYDFSLGINIHGLFK